MEDEHHRERWLAMITLVPTNTEDKKMRYFQSILIRCAVCTALLLMAGALPTRAAEWPDSLAAAKSEPPANAAEFIRASLENYRAELEAMCRLYEELGGALPSDAETFFTSAMIPKPSEFTIQVSADVLANPLPTHTDKRQQGILRSLRQTLAHRQNLKGYNLDALKRQAWDSLRKLGISNDYTIDAVIAADGITADLLDLPRMVYVHTSASAIKVIDGGYGTTTTGVRGVFKVEWDDELAGETNGPLTRLFGDKPGIHDVAAVGYNVFKRSEWKDGKVKIHTVPQKRFPGPRILVSKPPPSDWRAWKTSRPLLRSPVCALRPASFSPADGVGLLRLFRSMQARPRTN